MLRQPFPPLLAFLAGTIVVLTVVAAAHAQAPGPATRPAQSAQALRIGTYDSRAVAVAYVSSDAHNRKIRALQDERQQALGRGDTKRADQLKEQGQRQQTLRHLQGFSIAAVDDILAEADVQRELPRIAREANVSIIVREADFADASIEKVDVTDAMVRVFEPSEKTLKTVAELRKHKPLPLIDALGIKD